jgi:drug/metabolite transporter (DMT)-like permease
MLKNFIARIDRGVLFMLAASVCFAFMGAFAKLSAQQLSSIEVVFFRNLFGIIIIFATVFKAPFTHRGGRPYLLIFRGTIGFLALLAFFYNLAHIPIANAMTLSKTSPIFTAIFAFFLLKENLSVRGWVAVFVGFIGIVFITQPTNLGFSKYDLLGLFSGAGAALAYTSVRELRAYYDTRAIVLSFAIAGTVGPIILMAIGEFYAPAHLDFLFAPFVMPSGMTWVYIVALGIISTAAQLLMTKAYTLTKAGIVGAVSYMNIVFAIFVGLLIGDAFPDFYTSIGILLVIASGIAVAVNKKS